MAVVMDSFRSGTADADALGVVSVTGSSYDERMADEGYSEAQDRAIDTIAGALKQLGADKDVAMVVSAALERYSINVHGAAETDLRSILYKLKQNAQDLIESM